MKLNNINGTSDKTCACGSWLNHWKNFSDQPVPTLCPALQCLETTELGAHVQKDSATDKSWYIVPLCKTHNGQTNKSIGVPDSTKLVSANVKETCGK